MPIYEYQCRACAHRFERIQRFSDPKIESCPECGEPVDRLVHAPAIQFKGSGWYVTDYSDKGKPPRSEGAASSGADAKAKPAKAAADGGKGAKSD